MTEVAICTENLSKLYRVRPQEGYAALRDVMTRALVAPYRKLSNLFIPTGVETTARTGGEKIWAVKDVSLTIEQGEVVGIIGGNGAGKTTLLKILSGITQPTSGYAEVHGRVGSLLEVGTGFHPELTGRENVYLNGAILGMKRNEIRSNFDEIVGFAEVENYIDTPVKYYSTGMQVRLAFAVAAHLEPEIFLVDEVLAVGDAKFQKRCLGRMEDVAKGGRTVVFVSHSMQAISMLCKRVILLENGAVAAEGPAAEVVTSYLAAGGEQRPESVWDFKNALGNDRVKMRAVRSLNGNQEVSGFIGIGEPVTMEIEFWCLKPAHVVPSFQVLNGQGVLLFTAEKFQGQDLRTTEYEPGVYRCSCTIPANLLMDGTYYITAHLVSGPYNTYARKRDAISFRIHDDGSGRDEFVGELMGLIRPQLPWTGVRLGDLP